MEPALVVCPACLGTGADVLRSFTTAEAAQHFVLREGNPELHHRLEGHLRSLWKGECCTIMLCRNCGFGFAWPYVAGDAQFYELAYPHIGYTAYRWEFGRTLAALARIDTREMRVLEIGAGFGMFLDQLGRAGFPARDVCALEYHPDACAKLKEKGYRAIPTDVRSSDFAPPHRFDLIFMFQVVEHMDSLDELMDKLALIGSDRAHIFVSVPNAERTNYVEQHGWQFDMPPAHVGRWTLSAMIQVARRHGFRIECAEQQPLEGIRFLLNDVVSCYYLQAQRKGTRAHRVRALARSRVRRYLEMATLISYAPQRIPEWIRAFRHSGQLGGALWMHLVRSEVAEGAGVQIGGSDSIGRIKYEMPASTRL